MLSTKNITDTGSTFVSKSLNPGKNIVRINSIALTKGYDADSYRVLLNMEGPDLGDDFEGFYLDPVSKSGDLYKGQTGRVRLSAFDFKTSVTKTGIKIDRDQSILRKLKELAVATNTSDLLDAVEANNIEEFVEEANTILTGVYFNAVLAGKTYEKNGYTQYDLYLPNTKDGKVPVESTNVDEKDSKLITYDPAVHIYVSKPKTVDSFEATGAKTDNSFNL